MISRSLLIIDSFGDFDLKDLKGTEKLESVRRRNDILHHLQIILPKHHVPFSFLKEMDALPVIRSESEMINFLGPTGLDLHHPLMLLTLSSAWSIWQAHQPLDRDYRAATDPEGLVPYHFAGCLQSSPGTLHSIQRMKLLLKSEWRSVPAYRLLGLFATDLETPLFSSSFSVALSAANNSRRAALALSSSEDSVIYCPNAIPGHHAGRDFYGGYCLLCNSAILAAAFIERNKKPSDPRVVILNLDYHFSQGTRDVVTHHPVLQKLVKCVSIHMDPCFDYPTFCGHASEDQPMARIFTFPPGVTWNTGYQRLFLQALQAVRDFTPDLLIVELGTDTLKGDPNASVHAGACLEVSDFLSMGQLIRASISGQKTTPRIAVLQEGGYSASCPDAVANFLVGLCASDQTFRQRPMINFFLTRRSDRDPFVLLSLWDQNSSHEGINFFFCLVDQISKTKTRKINFFFCLVDQISKTKTRGINFFSVRSIRSSKLKTRGINFFSVRSIRLVHLSLRDQDPKKVTGISFFF